LGPSGEALQLDVAICGPQDAERCVVLSCGLHGVEGIAGSAIVRAWLEQTPVAGARLVVLHVLNPYGFAWRRRVDQQNIDLNRNFLLPGEAYEGSAPGWSEVAHRLAPGRSASFATPLRLWLLLKAASMGPKRLAGAVGGGQYSCANGLFFGGFAASDLQVLLRQNLPRWLAGAREVLHIDFHTGLGPFGRLQLFLPRTAEPAEGAALQARFGPEALLPRAEPRSFRTRGSLGAWCQALLPQVRYRLCAAEFGTRSSLSVLTALYDENRAHFGVLPDGACETARRRLVEVFAPQSLKWRSEVLSRGVRLIDQALAP
jgi:hypothetical protein